MSDGDEERKEQEERRKWEEKRKGRDEDHPRDWEKDGAPERRDSRAVLTEPYAQSQTQRGLIAHTDKQPDDYWTKLVYDRYAGL